MVSQSIACPTCHEALPPGRLSCPHCGTVLAAVARDFRAGATSAGAISATSWLDASSGTATVGSVTLAESPDVPDLPAVAPASFSVDAPSFADAPRAATAPTFVDPADLFDEDAPLAADGPPPTDDAPSPEDATRVVVEPPPLVDEPARLADEPAPAAAPLPEDRPTPVAAYLAALAEPPAPDPVTTSAAPPAGAWVPPAPPEADDPVDAPGPPARATRPVGDLRPVAPDVADPPARILPRAWDPSAAAAGMGAADASSAAAPGVRRFAWPEVNRERIDDAAGLVVLAGAMGAAVGFLLPWSRVVIGARNSGGYFDTWGLAASSHLVVFGLVLVALALAAFPNRIDTWVRTGVIGVALGSLLLGLAWPYAFGPLGAGLGVVLVVVSAFTLLAGGLLSTLVQRHSEPPPGV